MIITTIPITAGITMLESFIVRAIIAGCGVALVAGPLGCVIVWRRMAYFGDTLSHAALMGVALGLLLGIDPMVGVVAMGVLIGGVLLALQTQQRVPTDTLLGILSHTALAAGLIAISFLDQVRVDLMGYLFGDILSVSMSNILWIYGGGAVVLVMLAGLWRPLIAITVHEDTAMAEGLSPLRIRLGFTFLIALTVALAMKVVGILLITALLIIPPATARGLVRSPEGMAIGAMVAGTLAVLVGVSGSLAWDLPSGPAIVAAASGLFALSLTVAAFFSAQHR